MKKRKNSSLYKKLLCIQGLESKQLGRWLTQRKFHALRQNRDIVALVERVFKNCVILLFLIKAQKMSNSQLMLDKIISILECQVENKWTTFLDKLSTSRDQNMLTILLFKTLVQELTSKEKDYRPFWSPVYEELSEKLWLPTRTGLVDLGSTSSKALSTKQVEKLPCLTFQRTSLPNKNSQTTSYPLSISSVADKWGNDRIKEIKKCQYKTLPVPLKLSKYQKQRYLEEYHCFKYVHNKALERVKYGGEEPNFMELRNLVVTGTTKMGSEAYKAYDSEISRLKSLLGTLKDKVQAEKLQNNIKYEEQLMRDAMKEVSPKRNGLVSDFELTFSKETRSNAVNKVCESYKTARANFKAGNIKSYDISFMKKNAVRKCVEFSSTQIHFRNNGVTIPCFKGESHFKVSPKMLKKIRKLGVEPTTNCDLICHKGVYVLMVPVKIQPEEFSLESSRYCAVDPGLVKFATTFGNTGTYEYKHNRELLKRLNDKIKAMKNIRRRRGTEKKRKFARKRHLNKIEKQKINYTDQLHWTFINDILSNHDIVFFGDIKSHNIVKKGDNRNLNQEFNDIKFYRLKQRLQYKAVFLGKKVILTNEYLTTKTCSECGTLNTPDDRIYCCKSCGIVSDRDIQSAKNILMKGIVLNDFV